jgi:enduracididine biosynthesis enzyme MppP
LSGQRDGCDVPNLTELEIAAIESGINVADGHARHELTSSQQKIISQLPGLFAEAAAASVAVLDREAQSAFLGAIGQHAAVAGADVLTCYSSSVAMEICGRALQAAGVRQAALIHPTFDNIPDILRGVGMTPVPVSEEALMDGSGELPPDAGALFITTPNNPTGAVLPREALAHWARACATRGVILVLDTSFRGFDDRAQYDHYAVLADEGCRYVVVEDTGKLWPTLDLKAGFLVFPRGDQLPIRRIYTDLLLGISPLILLLVREFADDAAAGGLGELHQFIAANRGLLRAHLAGCGQVSFPDPGSRISVERVSVPEGTTGTGMWRALRGRGVHVLPCRQFYWADPQPGERFVRVALGRPPEMIFATAAAIGRQASPA